MWSILRNLLHTTFPAAADLNGETGVEFGVGSIGKQEAIIQQREDFPEEKGKKAIQQYFQFFIYITKVKYVYQGGSRMRIRSRRFSISREAHRDRCRRLRWLDSLFRNTNKKSAKQIGQGVLQSGRGKSMNALEDIKTTIPKERQLWWKPDGGEQCNRTGGNEE